MSASLLQQVPGVSTLAFCFSGQVRTFARQRVFTRMRTHVVEALGGGDVFFALGSGEYDQEFNTAPDYYAAFSRFNIVGATVENAGSIGSGVYNAGADIKEDDCYRQIIATETARGSNYSHILRTRPDLLWLHPLSQGLRAINTSIHLTDTFCFCYRALYTANNPCRGQDGSAAGPPGVPYDVALQYKFERVGDGVNDISRFYELLTAGYGYRPFLDAVLANRGAVGTKMLVNFYALMCSQYDIEMHSYLQMDVGTVGGNRPNFTLTCNTQDLAGSPFVEAYTTTRQGGDPSEAIARFDWDEIQSGRHHSTPDRCVCVCVCHVAIAAVKCAANPKTLRALC